ncbi:MAG: MnhB domain-containing protein [Luteolibacter sp.]
MNSIILSIASRYVGFVLIVLSLIALYRGHNYPGGGFIGGLIAASAFLLWALSHGWAEVREKIRFDPMNLLVIGLGLAMASGIPAFFNGTPYMTAQWGPAWYIPVLGKLKLGTPLLFDIGVYFAVVGFTLKSAIALGSEAEKDS